MKFISRAEQDIPLVRFAHSRDILFNTRNKFHISAQPCNILYIFTALYSKKYFGFTSASKCSMSMEFLLSNGNSSHSLNHRSNVFIFLPVFCLHLPCSTMLVSVPKCRCSHFLNNCISNVTMFSPWLCAQMEMLPFS